MPRGRRRPTSTSPRCCTSTAASTRSTAASRTSACTAAPGSTVRVRVINTDQGTAAVWSAAPFRVVAIDGHDVNAPTDVDGRAAAHPGRRASGCRGAGAGDGEPCACTWAAPAASLDRRSRGTRPPAARQPAETLDLLAYGDAGAARLRPDDARPHVRLRDRPPLRPHRRPPGQLLDHQRAHVPRRADVPRDARATSCDAHRNDSGDVHPMHLHGHHVVVLSRDGVAASGSPWWVDSLDVHPGESLRDRVRRRQPGHLERPLPHAPPRGRRARRPRHVRRASRRRSRSTAPRPTAPSDRVRARGRPAQPQPVGAAASRVGSTAASSRSMAGR